MANRRNPNADPGFDPMDNPWDMDATDPGGNGSYEYYNNPGTYDNQLSAGPAASQPQGPLAYGSGNYNTPGGLQQKYWEIMGITPGTKGHAGALAAKKDDLAKYGMDVISGDKIRLRDYGNREIDLFGDYNDQEGGLAVWQDNAFNADGSAYQGPSVNPPMGGGGTTANNTPSTGGVDRMGSNEIMEQLKKLFPDGAFNQDIVNRRTDNVAASLDRQRKSRLATNRAMLAERGLIGSGPEATSLGNMESDLYGQYANAVSGIHADESDAASQRMMQALQLAAGLSADDAANIVNNYRAETERTLGLGNLALGNSRAANEYNLGLGQLGLGRERLGWEMNSGNTDNLIKLIELYMSGANRSAGGYR